LIPINYGKSSCARIRRLTSKTLADPIHMRVWPEATSDTVPSLPCILHGLKARSESTLATHFGSALPALKFY